VVNAIAALIPGLILAAVAFPTKAPPSDKTMELIMQVGWLYLPMTFVLLLLSILTWSLYRIDEAAHSQNLSRIEGNDPT
jgi:Na+/melibiose symporter-like transporter